MEQFLRRMPKVELHCHLLGTVRSGTFIDLARRRERDPREDIEAFYIAARSGRRAMALRTLDEIIRDPMTLPMTRESSRTPPRTACAMRSSSEPDGHGAGISHSVPEAHDPSCEPSAIAKRIIGRLIPPSTASSARGCGGMIDW